MQARLCSVGEGRSQPSSGYFRQSGVDLEYPLGCAFAIVSAMPKSAITLEALPAGYGDCLFVTCPVGRRTWRMLVDTGPDETYPTLKARLAKLPANGCRMTRLPTTSVTGPSRPGCTA